jgi:hypothetical protein
MQFKETEGYIIVIDCAYVRANIAEEIAWYESQGYTLRSHAIYETRGLHVIMVSLIFIKNHEQ